MLQNKIQLSNFELALQYFRQGDFAEAQQYALQQLHSTPNHPDLIKLLCMIYVRKQDYNEAAKLIGRLQKFTQFDDELNNIAGSIYVELNDYDQASFYLKQVLSKNANNISAVFNLGLLHYNNKEYKQAIPLLSSFLEKNINHETALTILADCYLQLNELASALTCYQKINSINPRSAKAALGLLTIYVKQNQTEEIDHLINTYTANTSENSEVLFTLGNYFLSCHYYQHSVNIYQLLLPIMEKNPQLLTHLAITYEALDDTSNAIKYLQQAIRTDPNWVDAYSVLGNIYINLRQSDSAAKYLNQALTIDNCHVGANINMGRLKSYENNLDESDHYYFKAIKLDSHSVQAYFNLAHNARRRGDHTAAKNYLETCLEMSPSFADAEYNLGLIELATQNYANGWRHYFKRERTTSDERLSSITPGMDLSNQHICLCRAQGIGDELFFLRFVKSLKSHNNRISYRGSNKVFNLLTSNNDFDSILGEDETLPQADYYFAVDDLPLIVDMNSAEQIPAPLKLKVDPNIRSQIQKAYFSQKKLPMIGITWEAGTPDEKQNRKSTSRKLSKKIPLTHLVELLKPVNATFVILQRNPKMEDLAYITSNICKPIIDLSHYNEDLPQMLALLSLLDDYIGVSNTNMHLCAGIGQTAKVLVPHPPDWRWLWEGDSSPWFPGFSIYRQSINGGWDEAITRLRNTLVQHYG